MTTNYIDKNGNYINVKNLSLRQIYERGLDEGYKKGYVDGTLRQGDISKLTGGNT